ncbi:MAG: DUF3164 family protein [Lamprocystis purpurea]|jgi:hypothetical protein|uniref:DUF3164 family protein n=1 Tax=Lamprocystis purpurea TaxID=61598 RepID=UPI00037A86A8|nr:DUF3164 family protein [Lamprocystis purpurea]MBV5274428.1 DUF3164 family protein [Lamprocystis purpurea]
MSDQNPVQPLAAIPAGYLADAQDRLVFEGNIPDAERLRNALVTDLIAQVRTAHADLAALKAQLLSRVAEHVALVASDYNVDITGTSGNCVLISYNGRAKIERISADRIVVGEQIHAAEALVREYLADATREAGPALVAIVDRAFRRNVKTGQLNVARLLDFVAVKIDDQRWKNAQQAIRDSLQAQGSTTYFRAYERADATQPWQQVPLDFSIISPAAPEAPHA